jgi:hypothetical protein
MKLIRKCGIDNIHYRAYASHIVRSTLLVAVVTVVVIAFAFPASASDSGVDASAFDSGADASALVRRARQTAAASAAVPTTAPAPSPHEIVQTSPDRDQAKEQAKTALIQQGFAEKTECQWHGYYLMAGDGCSDRSTYRFWDGWEHKNRLRCVELQVQFTADKINVWISGFVNSIPVPDFPRDNPRRNGLHLTYPVEEFLNAPDGLARFKETMAGYEKTLGKAPAAKPYSWGCH